MAFETPILLLVFNRPDMTRNILGILSELQPTRLYIVADGPRMGNDVDQTRCDAVKKLCLEINWECSVNRLYRIKNMGAARSVGGGIDWFFEQEEMGIILEDDCVPGNNFFQFCEELLLKYQKDQRIFHIGGNNFNLSKTYGDEDYYFSIFNHIWGWATWKRAWKHYHFDIDIEDISKMNAFIKNREILLYFKNQFDNAIQGRVDAWDYRWTFACWKNHGLSVVPNKNLVSNIGFGDDATHTKNISSPQNSVPTQSIYFPLNHPTRIKANQRADLSSFRRIFQKKRTLRYHLGTFRNRYFKF